MPRQIKGTVRATIPGKGEVDVRVESEHVHELRGRKYVFLRVDSIVGRLELRFTTAGGRSLSDKLEVESRDD